uniref:ORF70 n=1 Tax=Nitrosopumilaceae spindle-shaped virus TaxID=3065433 RepID=A0AAT9J7E7_9VIRU
MPSIPESDKTITDMVDVVLESWKEPQKIETEDGKFRTERVINERRAWWQTHHIGTRSLGELAKELENLRNLFKSAGYHMTAYRADVLQKQGAMLCQVYDYMVDAKSSESLRDENNTNLTLLAMLAKAKTERQFSVKGELNKSVMDGILGRKANEQAG